MRSIVIDPVQEEPVREVDISGDLPSLYSALSCPATGEKVTNVEVAFVDELGGDWWADGEGWLHAPKRFVAVAGAPEDAYAGSLLILGSTPEGDSFEAGHDIDSIRPRVVVCSIEPEFSLRRWQDGAWHEIPFHEITDASSISLADLLDTMRSLADGARPGPLSLEIDSPRHRANPVQDIGI